MLTNQSVPSSNNLADSIIALALELSKPLGLMSSLSSSIGTLKSAEGVRLPSLDTRLLKALSAALSEVFCDRTVAIRVGKKS